MAKNRSRNPVALLMSAAFIVGAGLAVVWTCGGAVERETATHTPNPMSARAPGEAVPSAAEIAPPPADYTLVSDQLTTLDAATLPRDRPVTLGLSLPVASTNKTALAATIVDESGRRLDAKAAVQGTENQSAYLEIDSSWLAPGTYLIHLTTHEPSHLPLRRYPLVVR